VLILNRVDNKGLRSIF